jgi:hypothetical protein
MQPFSGDSAPDDHVAADSRDPNANGLDPKTVCVAVASIVVIEPDVQL